MSSEVAIRARGLGKVYRLYRRPKDRLTELVFRTTALGRDFCALRDIDFDVRRGESVGIIGRNGSGKSTLLQLVCGTVQPTTGELEVNGRIAALLQLGAGFNPEFTGRENVYLSASILGLSDAEIAKRFPSIEAFAEIGEFIDQPMRQYSTGMYARLAFAVCAHVDADILVVDEILAVGDAGFQQRCMRFLNAFRARGTLLFVSHDAAAVVSLCNRAIWLDQGIMRARGVTKEVCRRYHAFLSGASSDREGLLLEDIETASPSPTERPEDTAADIDPVEFDIDDGWVRTDMPMIERAWLSTAQGTTTSAVNAGDEVSLCVAFRAAYDIEAPVVAFVVRNRLGQAIFGDNTAQASHPAPARLKKGQRATATFRFHIPYLPVGEYAVQPALFERSGHRLVDRSLDSFVIRINSDPYLGGLANAAMRRTLLVIGGGASKREIGGLTPAAALPLIADIRWQGQNPMDVLPFRPDAPAHGYGGARIEDADFLFTDGSSASRIHGGEEVVLRIRASAQRRLNGPILGFMLRNALGQNVLGENTFLPTQDADRTVKEGETLTAYFHYQMPYLPKGDYLLAPSIIDGTQQDHIHLHWMEEALTVRVVESPIVQSVVGIPMIEVRLEHEPSEPQAERAHQSTNNSAQAFSAKACPGT